MRAKSQNSIYLSFIIALFLFSGLSSYAQTTVNSLSDLLPYLDDDSVHVKVAPGTYTITAADIENGTFGTPRFLFEGNNSTYDFTGVTINFAADVYTSGHSMSHVQTMGSENVLKNLTMVDLCDKHGVKKTGGVNVIMDGRDNRIEGFHITVKGSYPYGYGDVFGKGGPYTIKHWKHSAFLIRGLRNHALNDTIIHRSYGHAIFMQAASYPKVEGCYIEGEVRTTDDMLAETSGPAYDIDFMTIWGYRLLPGFMKSTGEEGIRAYNAGSTYVDGVKYSRATDNPTILNNTIINMRGGVTLTHANGTKYVEGCTAIGCERGYAIGAGQIINCKADAQHGAVFGVDYETNRNNKVEITLLPYEGETYNGGKVLAKIIGSGHNITFKSEVPNPDQSLTINIGDVKNGISSTENLESYSASSITIDNRTNYPIVLAEDSKNNTGVSGGMVTDFGVNNRINHIAVSTHKIEAEGYSNMYGISTEVTTDEGAGQNIDSIDTSDWMEYEIDVPYAGTYSMDYRVASESEAGDFSINVDGETIENVTFPATGGAQTWTTLSSASPFYLNKGIQKIKLIANSAGWNINWMDLLLECAASDVQPYVEIANPMGAILSKQQTTDVNIFSGNTLRLQPEPIAGGAWSWSGPNGFSANNRVVEILNFQSENNGAYQATFTNNCGQPTIKTFNVAIQDTFMVEAESLSNMNGVDTVPSAGASGGKIVSAIDKDDWFEFTIDVPFSAMYYIDYGIASESEGGFVQSIDSTNIEQINFSSTGGNQTWSTISSDSLVYLTEGTHSLHIASNSSGWSLDWIKLRGENFVSPCALPISFEGFTVENDTVDWSSGLIDISCVASINFYANIAGIGDLEAHNYFNIYYKLDGGELVPISENTGKFDENTIIARELSGSTFELIVQAQSEHAEDYSYKIADIKILETTDPFARIEAEDYDEAEGTQTQATTDTGAGSNVSTIREGNWLLYRNLDLSFVHSINARLASINSGGTMEIRLNSYDGIKIGKVEIPNTGGWQTWQTVSASLASVTGVYDIYLVFSSPETSIGNINWFQFSDTYVFRDPFAKIEAEDYDNMFGIGVEATSDDGGGSNVGSINSDDWLLFTNIDLTNVESIDARVASIVSSSSIEIRIDSLTGTLLGTIEIPRTYGYQKWKTVNAELVEISGMHDIYLVFKGGGGYIATINWLQFIGTPTAITSDFAENDIMIYPNPVADKLIIKGALNLRFEIYNNVGKLIDSNFIENDRQSIDMNRLISGMYFLRILDGNQALNSFKVVKQ